MLSLPETNPSIYSTVSVFMHVYSKRKSTAHRDRIYLAYTNYVSQVFDII